MIWNPWKKIAKLREDARRTAVFRQYDGAFIDQQRAKIAALEAERERNALIHTERLDGYKQLLTSTTEGRSHLFDVLLAIIKEEKPTSNATVKRICKMAREALG